MGSCHVPDRRWVRLRKPNVRRSVLDDAAFEKLLAAAESQLKPIILVAYGNAAHMIRIDHPMATTSAALRSDPSYRRAIFLWRDGRSHRHVLSPRQ